MKKIFLFSMLIGSLWCFSQDFYTQQWNKIEQNTKSGIFKSNAEIIGNIKTRAMKENNIIQLVKALKSEFSIQYHTDDDEKNNSESDFLQQLKSIEKTLKGNDKAFFNVLIMEFAMDYYQNNSWRINLRTNLDQQGEGDIETWTPMDFKNFINNKIQFIDPLSSQLKNISLNQYKTIFDRSEEEFDVVMNGYQWYELKKIEFWNSQLFTKNEKVANKSFINKTYNELIATSNGNSKLYFLEQQINYNHENQQSKDYFNQLKALYQSNTQGDYKVFIANSLMQFLENDGQKLEALKIGEDVKKQYPQSKYLTSVQNTESRIKLPSLTLQYERQTLPNQPIQLVANSKNMDAFSVHIYEVTDPVSFLNYVKDSYTFPFNNLKKTLIRKENFDLKNKKDFQFHKTAFEVKGLPSGLYVAQNLINGKSVQDFYFIVSELAIITISNDLAKPQFRLVHADNGKSFNIQDVVVYDFENQKNNSFNEIKTDKNGNFDFPKQNMTRYHNEYLVQQKGTKNFTFSTYYKNNSSQRENTSRSFSQIFLDRKIYRPGQAVYFKVITKKSQDEKTILATNQTSEIILFDANRQEISKQKFTTNEFGSYSGSFTLPLGQLNGVFSLRVNSNEIGAYEDFRVEEYKRPKFEVDFEPIKDEYQYGQMVEVKGKAMMFSGVPLGNSTVQYEIKKQNILWRYFSRFPRNNSEENSILGEVKTDDKGEFIIKVNLEKDSEKEGIQIDAYQIKASVTDINGETQEANTTIKVASVSHYLEIGNLTDGLASEPVKVAVHVKNYNDQPLDKPYQLKLIKLEEPNRVLRENFREAIQDNPHLTYEEFVQKFPHDYYSKEELELNWKEEKVVQHLYNQKDKNINFGQLEPGKYRLEVYNIENKDTINVKKDFSIWSPNGLGEHQKPFLEVIQSKKLYKQGEKAKFYVYSAVPNALVNIFIQDGRGNVIQETKPFKKGFLLYEVTVPTNDLVKALNVQFQIVGLNDIQTKNLTIEIEETKKPLRIETVTFRDRLEPGQKEKWSIKILGEDKEQINAEILASMYDQSLDQFASNRWSWKQFQLPINYYSFNVNSYLLEKSYYSPSQYYQEKFLRLPEFSWFDYELISQYSPRMYKTARLETASVSENMVMDTAAASVPAPMGGVVNRNSVTQKISNDKGEEELIKVPIRENLNETAFFYPHLLTDKDGNLNFEFVSPEALTQWKLMFLAHTKDARAAVLEKEVVTQKEFSVTPNYPRFLREGDELLLQTKISSLVDKKLNGKAQLQILDATTNQDITSLFKINAITQDFSLDELGSSVAKWRIKVPQNISTAIIKVVAQSGMYSDGEQKAVAVLPNRMLVTDALPIFVKEGQTKTFVLDTLKNNQSSTITNVSNTLELTTNPVWELMFALPHLKQDQNQSADVVFNRWFADVLASEIFRSNPRMKTIFDEYQSKGLLISNLEKNQELKYLLLEETPWVLESKNETEQMQKLARIFDVNTMRNALQNDWMELVKLQNSDGGFSWYQGYPSSYYTSIYILKNLGRINDWLKENIKDYQSEEQDVMVQELVDYVDREVNRYWINDKSNLWSNFTLDYLDARRYWEKSYPLKGKGLQLKKEVITKAKNAQLKEFTFYGLHRSAILFNHFGLKDVSNKLMKYLKETSTESEKQGAYWKSNLNDWGWYNTNFINHAGALEAFQKLKPEEETFIEELKIWLVTQKEANTWGSSRGTAEVIFTFLNSGKSWTSVESDQSKITWGNQTLSPQTSAIGYLKQTIQGNDIDKNWSTVTIEKSGPGIVQGGIFWQYFEDLDKIKSSENYISITKELYKKVKTVNGEELKKITPETPLSIGDKVTVRMILNTDRNMEFVHIKDMRASGFEPIDVLSGYQWKNNLGYYQSTKDASTNFYIEYLPKGKYVFEYDFVANAAGSFSNGITTMQNYYAPQMNAHTKGTRVEIKE